MKQIALRAGKKPFEPLSLHETALRGVSATNVGNMVFSEAALKALSRPDVDVTPLGYAIHKIDPQRINEQFDAVVLPFANAFRLAWKDQLIAYTRFLEKLRIPVVVMGVGIQTDFEYNLDHLKPIEKETKAFVSAVLDRSNSIGVRGEASKQFLTKLGFHDQYVDVIGCPSMFRYGPQLPLDMGKLEKPSDESAYALNMTGGGFNDRGLKSGKEKLLSIIDCNIRHHSESDLLLQNNHSLITMLWGRGIGKGLEYDGLPCTSRHMLDQGRAKQFVDPSTWIDFLSKKDFVVGSRIHGNITALLAGTPSFVLATDSRTRELCEYFHIPFQRLSDVGGRLDVEEFKQKADYSRLVSNYGKKFDAYLGFLEKNSLSSSFETPEVNANFEKRLRLVDFPRPASGVNSGMLLKQQYWVAWAVEKMKQKLAS